MQRYIFFISFLIIYILLEINCQDQDSYQEKKNSKFIEIPAFSKNQKNTDTKTNEQQNNDQNQQSQNQTTIIPKNLIIPERFINNPIKQNCTQIRQNIIVNKTMYGLPENYNFCKSQGSQYYNLKNYLIEEYGDQTEYQQKQQIGEGHFSDVFLGQKVGSDELVVLKNLNNIKVKQIKKEHKILTQLKGGPNIIKLLDAYPLKNDTQPGLKENNNYVFKGLDQKLKEERQKFKLFGIELEDTSQQLDRNSFLSKNKKPKNSQKLLSRAGFVFEYEGMKSVSLQKKKLEDIDIRIALYDTLQALNYTHSKGIMHRDVKPGNILYDKINKKTKLIDYGVSDYFHMINVYPYQVSTKGYKAPELMLNFTCYDFSVDTWSVGITMARLIFQNRKIMGGDEDSICLKWTVNFFGTDALINLIQKLGIKINKNLANKFPKKIEAKNWDFYKSKSKKQFVDEQAIDLLEKLMKFDFTERISPEEALSHPYFDIVKEYRQSEQQQNQLLEEQKQQDSEEQKQQDSEEEVNSNIDGENRSEQRIFAKKSHDDL